MVESDLSAEDIKHCTALIEKNAKDLYLADLLLPANTRPAISVLHAFHVEVANICLSGGEPMAGEIRLQWWVDILSGQRIGEAQGHPVARSLLTVIEKHSLPVSSFIGKLEAHIFDLYNDPMGDRTDFEGYCGETRSCLFQWAAMISGAPAETRLADASGHAGVATGIAALLENMHWHRQSAKVFVPSDLLLALGMNSADLFGDVGRSHEVLVEGLVAYGRDHLVLVTRAIDTLDPPLRRAFNPLALVPLYMDRAERAPMAVYEFRKPVSQLRRQWALWRF